MTTGNGYLLANVLLLSAVLLGGCNGSSQSLESPPPPDALEPMDEPPGLEGATDMTPDAPPE